MKKHQISQIFLGILCVFAIDAGSEVLAADNSSSMKGQSSDLFFNEKPIGNDELDTMRGGFVTRTGMMIDFSFSANTLVDGQLINQVVLNTADLAANLGSLRSVIQVGEGNVAFNEATNIANLPNVLTVIQNNLNDLTIQQLNVLDLTVQNMSQYTANARMPEIDFQNTLRLDP